MQLASKCAKACLHIKEELCFFLADGLDSKFVQERTNSVKSIARLGDAGISLLIAALRDENADVRGRAADALGNIKSEKGVDPLIAALRDENTDVRGKAADALGNIKSEKAIDLLIAALRDEKCVVPSRAAYALVSIKSEKAIDLLIAALRDKNIDVSLSVAYALGSIKSEKVVYPLIAALHDEDYYVSSRAADALGIINSEKTVDLLIAALHDEKDYVRSNAADALGSIKSEKAVDQLIAALQDKNDEVRSRAADALGSIKSEKAVDQLIAALQDKNDEVRSRAADALVRIKSEKAIDPFIAALRDENIYVRCRAAYALGNIKSKKAVDQLIAALSDENNSVHLEAANALDMIKSEKAVNPLIAALCESGFVRKCEIKSEKSVDQLIAELRDEDLFVSNNAEDVLSIKLGKSVDQLIAALRDEDYYVRKIAASALGNIKSEKGVDPLIAALRDENTDVRGKAADALGSIKSEKAVDQLIIALRDEDHYVRIWAADALKKICTYRHKDVLKQFKDSDNEYQANTVYNLLNEIEQSENSKKELFLKKPGLREKSETVLKHKDPFGAHPAEDGMVDAYIGMFPDRIKSIREHVTLIDYGCGEGMLLGAMKSLPVPALENISYIGVDVKTKYLFMTELNSRKFGLYEKFRVEPEFLKPERLYAKNIPVDYALMIHTLHEVRLVDLVDVIYNISSKLRVGGRFFILEQRKLLEKEMNFVLWDEDDFKMLFLNSGFMPSWRPVETKSGNKLSSIEMEKVKNDCFSREKVAERCISVYYSKKEKVLKECSRSGITYEDFQQLSMLFSNISIQMDEYDNRLKNNN